jgi:hypothetical protein
MSALENRFDHLRKTSLEQEAALLFFRNIIEACAEPAATAYALSPAGYDSAGKDLILLREKIREHEARFAMFSKKLEEMSDRLAALETGMHRFDLPGSGSSSRENPCTALVIDARHAGFAPCLEPKIFVKGVLVYPGGDTDRGTAICNGYARYYRQLDSAEKSRYAGARPCIIKAKGTYEGKRSLEIEQGDYEILKQFSEISPLSGRMAIVF